jgi:Rrf2 family nitric oxide-sensitive transcriptional repressor
MKITQFTDYSLRVLLYVGLKGERATVNEITRAFRISKNHLVKVVHSLSHRGYIRTHQGKNGGFELALDPSQIRIGEFVKEIEPLLLLECFDADTNTCPIRSFCQLERALVEAQKAFLDSLNRDTLQDYLKSSPMKTERMKR